jgi:hypothetical protein
MNTYRWTERSALPGLFSVEFFSIVLRLHQGHVDKGSHDDRWQWPIQGAYVLLLSEG